MTAPDKGDDVLGLNAKIWMSESECIRARRCLAYLVAHGMATDSEAFRIARRVELWDTRIGDQ